MVWNPFRRVRPPLRFSAGLLGPKGRPSGSNAAEQTNAFAREDQDENLGVRSLNGGSQLELTEGERIRALRLSRRLYYRNGIYGQLVDLFVSWILGDGVVVKHENEAANEFLQETLDYPDNAFHERLSDRVTRWLVDGELPWTFLVPYTEQPERNSNGVPIARLGEEGGGKLAGVVFFGRADPMAIGEIKVSVLDVDHVKEVVLNPIDGDSLASGVTRRPLPIGEVGTPPEDVGRGSSALQVWRLNPLGVRGMPLLSRIIDKADVLDRVVQGMADKVELTNRFYMHVTYPATGDIEKDEAFEKKVHAWIRGARYGESCVTPEGVEMKAIAPDLKLPDTKEAYEVTLDWNLGSVGVPRMWFSSGGDTNRATSVEQGSPIHRMIRKKQSELQAQIVAVAAYTVYLGQLAGRVPATVDPKQVSVTLPEVATRDTLRDTEEVTNLALGTRDLVDAKAITPKERQRILRRKVEVLPMGEELEGAEPPPLEDGDGTGAAGGTVDPATGRTTTDGLALPAAGSSSSGGGKAAAAAATVGAAAVQDTGLNGAQVTAAKDILQGVSDGTFSAEAAKLLLLEAFPAWDEPKAAAMVAAAEKFEPTPPAPSPQDIAKAVAERDALKQPKPEAPPARVKEGVDVRVELVDGKKPDRKVVVSRNAAGDLEGRIVEETK